MWREMLFDERTKHNAIFSYIVLVWGATPYVIPRSRQPVHPLHRARQARVPNHPALPGCLVVPLVGVEPTRPCGHLILSQACLPVPPQGEFDWYISIIYHASVVRYIAYVRDEHCSIGAMCGITTSSVIWSLFSSRMSRGSETRPQTAVRSAMMIQMDMWCSPLGQ